MAAFAGLSVSAGGPAVGPEPATAAVQSTHLVLDDMPTSIIDPSSSQRNRFTRAADGLFYVSARVNGLKVRFLLDTGATMVVLTKADAERVGATRNPAAAKLMMETAAGPSAIDRVTLDHVAIAGHHVTQVDAAIVRRGLKVSLLGQDLLSRLGPVTISGNALELH